MRGLFLTIMAVVLTAGAAIAQHHTSGYSSMMARPIKALSEEQTIQLREGRGMGLSLPAELNSYPGPLHVLEMAFALDLSDTQKIQLAQIQSDMKTKAVALGLLVIAAEARLDNGFASGQADAAQVSSLLSEIGRLNADLRAAHILAHMETKAVLTPAQINRYDVERGYRPAVGQQNPSPHGGHGKPH